MWEWDSSSIIILLLLYLKQKKLPIFLISAPADQSSFPKSLLPCPESETDLRKFLKGYAFAENGSRAQNFQLLSTRKLFINPVLLPCTLF